SLADLLDETRLEPIDIGIGEESVDALVGRDVLHEVVDHGRNGGIAAKPIIKRSRLGKRTASSKRECEQRDGGGERASSERHGGSSSVCDGVSSGCGGARLLPSADTEPPAEWFQRPLVKSPRPRRIKARSRFEEAVPRMTEK